jgi:hypothetical protein
MRAQERNLQGKQKCIAIAQPPLKHLNAMSFLHVLHHVSLAEPPFSVNMITSCFWALKWGRMFLLQMNFQELEGFEAVLPDIITIFKMARECRRAQIGCFVPSDVLDVMVIANMLTKVILALETVVASISMRLSEVVTLDAQKCCDSVLHNEK